MVTFVRFQNNDMIKTVYSFTSLIAGSFPTFSFDTTAYDFGRHTLIVQFSSGELFVDVRIYYYVDHYDSCHKFRAGGNFARFPTSTFELFPPPPPPPPKWNLSFPPYFHITPPSLQYSFVVFLNLCTVWISNTFFVQTCMSSVYTNSECYIQIPHWQLFFRANSFVCLYILQLSLDFLTFEGWPFHSETNCIIINILTIIPHFIIIT